MKLNKLYLVILFSIAANTLWYCGSTRTAIDFYQPVKKHIQTENYAHAVAAIDAAKQAGQYEEKDRVVYYLDKGVTLFYMNKPEESNRHFDMAELAMEELFTKSISKAALSFLLNDNAMDYFGEIYENLYLNIFKAINYLRINNFDGAYVEINRVNDKLRELDLKYGEYANQMNENDKAHGNVQYNSANFYNNALANYLSYLIFRAEGEEDNSRISFDKMSDAWRTQPNIYNYPKPESIRLNPPKSRSNENSYLNIIAFTGQAPFKYAVGGKITTFKNSIGITDLGVPMNLPNIFWPGMKPGYHFKFAFPAMGVKPSVVDHIDVFLDGRKAGNLVLFEDMGNIAVQTFESSRDLIVLKTVLRTVAKGLVSAEAKKKLRKETQASGFLGALMDAAVDAAVDATENPDLRCWRTMPQLCYVGEFELNKGTYDVEIRFISPNGSIISKRVYPNYKVDRGMNLIDAFSLN